MATVWRKALIFVTFFGCCIALAFEAAAFATQQWVCADAKRNWKNGTIDDSSKGHINLGLFRGRKYLNFGYGTRVADFSVTSMSSSPDAEVIIFELWVATLTLLGLGVLLSLVTTLFAALNTATTPVDTLAGTTGLLVWNSLAVCLLLGAAITWVVQFFVSLQDSVLPEEDRVQRWHSEGLAELGFSFWFVVGAAAVHVVNILLILLVMRPVKTSRPPRHGRAHSRPPRSREQTLDHSKVYGTIMLY